MNYSWNLSGADPLEDLRIMAEWILSNTGLPCYRHTPPIPRREPDYEHENDPNKYRHSSNDIDHNWVQR